MQPLQFLDAIIAFTSQIDNYRKLLKGIIPAEKTPTRCTIGHRSDCSHAPERTNLQGSYWSGGRERIRTSGRLTPTPDFESGAFNHSATLPQTRTRSGVYVAQNQGPGKSI